MPSTKIPADVMVGVTRQFGFDIPVTITEGQERGRTETMFAHLGTIETGRKNSRERSPQSVANRAVAGTLQKAREDLQRAHPNNPNLKLFPGNALVTIYGVPRQTE